MLRILILWLLTLMTLPLLAQSSPILEAYIQKGLQSNLALQQSEVDVEKSRTSIRQARALFMPTVQFNANYTLAGGGRSIEFPLGDLLNPVYGTLNQLTQSNQFPMLENQQIRFLPNNFQETKLKFAYPIYNTDLKYNQRIQTHLSESQVAQRDALAQELRYEITTAYLEYVQAVEAQAILESVRVTLTELKHFNESLVRNNVATRDVVATADYQLTDNQYQTDVLRLRQERAKAYFNFLINSDLGSEVTLDPTLMARAVPIYSLDSCMQVALAQRAEFRALRAGQSAADAAVDLNEANQRLPDLYVGGELGFQGFGYRIWEDQAYVLAQVGMTYDLYNGSQNKLKTQQARLDAEKTNLRIRQVQQQVSLQIWDAHKQLEAARATLTNREAAVVAASESFRVIQNKYKAGQTLLIEYTDAQNRLTMSRIQVSLAQVDLRIKEAALLKALGR
jgi:outer membrane protein